MVSAFSGEARAVRLARTIRRLWTLDRAQRRLLIQMCYTTAMIELRLRTLGYRRTADWLDRRDDGRLALPQATIMQMCRLVADRILGRDGKCLRFALLAKFYLRRSGYPAEVQIGYREMNGRIEGHAWVESAGRVLSDDPHVREHYPAKFHSVPPTYFSRETRKPLWP